jgi:hypothetical protein
MATTVKRKEYFLSLDNFNRPAEVTGGEAVALLIARLIMLEPGSDPLHPTMGVGLVSKYRYSNKLEDLKTDIKNQISTWLPDFVSDTDISLIITPDKVLNVEIMLTSTGEIYKFSVNSNDHHTLNEI